MTENRFVHHAHAGDGLGDRADPHGARPAGRSRGPLITVTVCTRGRLDALRRLLASLEALSDPCHEILIVDNHPQPTLEGFEGGRVRVVHEPRPGLDFARNRGIAEARGTIVAFVDDDCEVDPAWLTHIRAAFTQPGIACVTGRVVAGSMQRPSERWFERMTSFDRGPRARWFRRSGEAPVLPDEAAQLGTGCNMAFQREVFDRIGLFDQALDMGTPVGGGGDLDVFARVLSAGEAVLYEPRALVRHYHRATMRELVAQLFGYGVAIGALSTKLVIGRQARLGRVLAFQRRWVRWTALGVTRNPRGKPLVGFVLVAALVAGDLYGPAAYALSRRRSRRVTRA